MLTYSTGPAGNPLAAQRMAAHLMQPTLGLDMEAELRQLLFTPPPPSPLRTPAEVRRDLDPRLAQLLALDPVGSVTLQELSNVLLGRRSDGQLISGRPNPLRRRSLMELLALDTGRLPTAAEVDWIIRERQSDGSGMPQNVVPGAPAMRLLELYGVPPWRKPGPDELAHIRAGRLASGAPMRLRPFVKAISARPRSVAYLDLCWSADKTVSLAALLAPSGPERALVVQAHRDAVSAAMLQAEVTVGRARRGKGGRDGFSAGHTAWLTFTHFTSRPLGNGSGDPQLHTHAIMPNLVVAPSTDGGHHLGGLDLNALAGRIKPVLGPAYQVALADNLRRLGADVATDPATGAAQLRGVPHLVQNAFAKRTNAGTLAAEARALSAGVDWEALPPARRAALVKRAVQGEPTQGRHDGLADTAAWLGQAGTMGWHPCAGLTLVPRPPVASGRAGAAPPPVRAAAGDGWWDRATVAYVQSHEASVAAALARKVATGEAAMVAGEPGKALAAAAERWMRLQDNSGSNARVALPIAEAPTPAGARAFAAAIRTLRRAAGEVGPDLFEVDAVDNDGSLIVMPLAAGDRIRLLVPANPAGVARAGAMGGPGTILRVLDAGKDGLLVRDEGRRREGFLRWATLRSRSDGRRLRIAQGDATTPQPGKVSEARGAAPVACRVVALPAGASSAAALGAHYVSSLLHGSATLVFSEEIERAAARTAPGQDLWTAVVRAMAAAPERGPGGLDPEWSVLRTSSVALRHAAIGILQEGAFRLERRQAAGLSPAPALSRLRDRRCGLTLNGMLDLAVIGRPIGRPMLAVPAAIADALGRLASGSPGSFDDFRPSLARAAAEAVLMRRAVRAGGVLHRRRKEAVAAGALAGLAARLHSKPFLMLPVSEDGGRRAGLAAAAACAALNPAQVRAFAWPRSGRRLGRWLRGRRHQVLVAGLLGRRGLLTPASPLLNRAMALDAAVIAPVLRLAARAAFRNGAVDASVGDAALARLAGAGLAHNRRDRHVGRELAPFIETLCAAQPLLPATLGLSAVASAAADAFGRGTTALADQIRSLALLSQAAARVGQLICQRRSRQRLEALAADLATKVPASAMTNFAASLPEAAAAAFERTVSDLRAHMALLQSYRGAGATLARSSRHRAESDLVARGTWELLLHPPARRQRAAALIDAAHRGFGNAARRAVARGVGHAAAALLPPARQATDQARWELDGATAAGRALRQAPRRRMVRHQLAKLAPDLARHVRQRAPGVVLLDPATLRAGVDRTVVNFCWASRAMLRAAAAQLSTETEAELQVGWDLGRRLRHIRERTAAGRVIHPLLKGSAVRRTPDTCPAAVRAIVAVLEVLPMALQVEGSRLVTLVRTRHNQSKDTASGIVQMRSFPGRNFGGDVLAPGYDLPSATAVAPVAGAALRLPTLSGAAPIPRDAGPPFTGIEAEEPEPKAASRRRKRRPSPEQGGIGT